MSGPPGILIGSPIFMPASAIPPTPEAGSVALYASTVGGSTHVSHVDENGNTFQVGHVLSVAGVPGNSINVTTSNQEVAVVHDVNTGVIGSYSGAPSFTLDNEGHVETITPGGVANSAGGQIQAARVAVGAVAKNTLTSVALMWPHAFADLNYTIALSLLVSAAAAYPAAFSCWVTAMTLSGCTVVVENAGPATTIDAVHAIAIHD